MEKMRDDNIIENGNVEMIEAQSIDDMIESGKVDIEKTEKIDNEFPENPPKKRRGRPRKEDVEARKKKQARQYLESVNLIIPEPYKLTEFEINALVETGADKIIHWLGSASDSDMAFWMMVYGILDARLHITQKLLQVARKRMEK